MTGQWYGVLDNGSSSSNYQKHTKSWTGMIGWICNRTCIIFGFLLRDVSVHISEASRPQFFQLLLENLLLVRNPRLLLWTFSA